MRLKKLNGREMKALFILSTIVLISAFPFFLMMPPPASGNEATAEGCKQLALMFVEKVVGINLSNYITEIDVLGSQPNWDIYIKFQRRQESATIWVEFARGKIWHVWCKPETPPSWLWADQADNSLSAVKQMLERYQFYFNTSSSPFNATYAQFGPLLDKALPNQNQTITDANMIFEIKGNGHSFSWSYDISGIEKFIYLGIDMTEDGRLKNFWDNVGVYTIGSTEVNVSEEQAVSVALGYAQNYAEEHGRTIKAVNATLEFINDMEGFRGGTYVFYFHWSVTVTFEESENDPYIFGYQVSLWADTGRVISHHEAGVIGGTGTRNQPNYLPGVSIAAISALAATVFFIAFRKRRLNNARSNKEK